MDTSNQTTLDRLAQLCAQDGAAYQALVARLRATAEGSR